MKVYLITIHNIHNFGSIFQTLALQEYVNSKGCDAEIIDYRPKYNLAGKNRLRTFLGKVLNFKDYLKKKKKFNSFIDKELKMTPLVITHKDLKEQFQDAKDCIYLVGGDQLWNPFHYCGNDGAYRLTFLPDACEKYSYGTSLGKKSFSKEEISSLVNDLRSFKKIGVREGSSVDILKESGITNVTNVCDPVMLMDSKFYNKYLGERIIKEKYIFVYLVDKSDLLISFLEHLKHKYNYKIVHVCGFRKKFDNDYMIKSEGPDEVLNLLVNAEIVVSASFHATLFSIIYQKEFYSFLPGPNTNERIQFLLGKMQLQDRIIDSKDFLKNTNERIDYFRVNEVKDAFIKESKIYLDSILGNEL